MNRLVTKSKKVDLNEQNFCKMIDKSFTITISLMGIMLEMVVKILYRNFFQQSRLLRFIQNAEINSFSACAEIREFTDQ